MGRGRAKAKQTKVARDLKYNTRGTDLDRLARELGANRSTVVDDDGEFGAFADEEDDDEVDGDEDDGGNYRSHHRGY
jgi:hypothetical protein